MSKQVNNQVVQMTFDNKAFEKNAVQTMNTIDKLKLSLQFKGVAEGLREVSKSLSMFPIKALGNAADAVTSKFGVMGTAIDQLVRNAEIRIESFARNAVNQLNVFKGGIASGFSEYETQINAVQTIWANTKDAGTTMEDITRVLDELNTYADMTIYNFTEMTRNIGTFTAAGVDLDKATKAIQGIANLGAISGSSSAQVSNAMYQLSQALAAGRVSLMDWNSVVNAGMGGKTFQKVLIQTAKEMGTISNELATGLENGTEVFRNTLTENAWLTSEVLTASLAKFTDTSTELGRTATDAATKVKTFTQLISTLKESVQSGWTQSWEYIIGDFESARALFTDISNAVTALIQPSMDARNEMLAYWSGANEANVEAEEVLKEQEEHQKIIADLAKRANMGEFGNGEDRRKAIEALGYDYREVQNAINHIRGLGDAFVIENEKAEEAAESNEKVTKTLDEMSGREAVLYGLSQISEHLSRVGSFVSSAFKEVFPSMTGAKLVSISKDFAKFAESIKPSRDQLRALQAVTMGILNAFKLVGKVVGGVARGIINAFNMLPDVEIDYDRIREASAEFAEFVNNFEKDGYLEKLINKTTQVTTKLLNAVKYLGDILNEYLIDPVKSFFSKFSDKGIKATVEEFWGNIKALFSPDKVETDKKAFDDKMAELTDPLNKAMKKLSKFFAGASDQAIDIGKVVLSFAKELLTWDTLFNSIKLVGLIMLFKRIHYSNKAIKNGAEVLDSIGNFFDRLTKSVKTITKDVKKLIKAHSFKAIATGVLLLTAALTIIIADIYIASKIWGNDPEGAIAGFIGVIVIFGALLLAVKKLSEYSIKPSTIFSMITTVISLWGLIGAIATIGSMKPETLEQGAVICTILTFALLAVSAILGFINSRVTTFETAGKSLVRLTTALNLLVLPILALSLMTMEGSKLNVDKALKIILGLLVAMVGLVALLSAITTTVELKSVAGTILAISGSIALLTVPLVVITALMAIAGDKIDLVWHAAGLITLLFIVLSAVVVLMTWLTGSGDIAVSAGVIIAISVALNLLMIPIVVLTLIAAMTDLKTLWSAGGVLMLLMGVFAGVMIAMSKFSSKGDLIVQALSLIVFAGVLTQLAEVLAGLAQLDQTAMWSSVVALTILLAVFGALSILLSKFSGKLDLIVMSISIIAFATALVIMAYAFQMIAEIPSDTMQDFVGVVLKLTLTFAAFIAVLAILNYVFPGSTLLILLLIDVGIAAAAALGFAIAAIADSITNLLETIMKFVAFIEGKDVEVMNATSESISNGLTNATKEGGEIDLAAVAAGEQTMSSFVKGMNSGESGIIDAATMSGVAAGETSISSIVKGMSNTESDLYSQSETTGVNAIDSVSTGMEMQGPKLYDGANQIGSNTIGNLSNGVLSEADKTLYPNLDTVSSNMLTTLNSGLGVSSPSTETWMTGKWFDMGLVEGVKDNLSEPLDAIKDMGGKAVDTLKESLGGDDVTEGLFNTDDLLNLDGLTDMNLDDLGMDATITPVMDLSNVTSGVSDMNSMFGSQSLGLSDLNSSFNGNLNMGDIQNGSYDDAKIVSSIAKLDARMDALASAISSMQIRMDTGALVGSIAGPMDTALGQRAVYAGRGIR